MLAKNREMFGLNFFTRQHSFHLQCLLCWSIHCWCSKFHFFGHCNRERGAETFKSSHRSHIKIPSHKVLILDFFKLETNQPCLFLTKSLKTDWKKCRSHSDAEKNWTVETNYSTYRQIAWFGRKALLHLEFGQWLIITNTGKNNVNVGDYKTFQ